jgi:hypothetical protein
VAVPALAALGYALKHYGVLDGPAGTTPSIGDRATALRQAFLSGRSDIWVEGAGAVERVLPDDDLDSRHQRFIVRLDGELTVLIAHNIDLAPRVPLAEGDTVAFRGEYEWSEKGGTVHWTHHDPAGRRAGGWLEHGGKRYE